MFRTLFCLNLVFIIRPSIMAEYSDEPHHRAWSQPGTWSPLSKKVSKNHLQYFIGCGSGLTSLDTDEGSSVIVYFVEDESSAFPTSLTLPCFAWPVLVAPWRMMMTRMLRRRALESSCKLVFFYSNHSNNNSKKHGSRKEERRRDEPVLLTVLLVHAFA